MEYEIRTLKDIYEKVPAEKIEQCLKELCIAMMQAKHMDSAIRLAAKDVTGEYPDKGVEWPEVSTWIDDDSGEIDLTFEAIDGSSINVKSRLGA